MPKHNSFNIIILSMLLLIMIFSLTINHKKNIFHLYCFPSSCLMGDTVKILILIVRLLDVKTDHRNKVSVYCLLSQVTDSKTPLFNFLFPTV